MWSLPFGYQPIILYTFRSVFSFAKIPFSSLVLYCRGAQFFQKSRSHLKILCESKVIRSKFQAEDAVCVCACLSCPSKPIPLIISEEFDFFFYKTCCGHGAIQGYRNLVTPVTTVVSPREFEQIERYCSCKKCSYYASIYIPAVGRVA